LFADGEHQTSQMIEDAVSTSTASRNISPAGRRNNALGQIALVRRGNTAGSMFSSEMAGMYSQIGLIIRRLEFGWQFSLNEEK
jgi:hypothetical protein